MVWIDIKIKQPIWYKNVDIKVDGKIKLNYHRLSGDDNEVYYGSLETDEIVYEDDITHWREKEKK